MTWAVLGATAPLVKIRSSRLGLTNSISQENSAAGHGVGISQPAAE
jgi:hypothetical protein